MGIARFAAMGAGAAALIGVLEHTDGDTIREVGQKIGDAVQGAGERFADSEIGIDLKEKLAGTEYGQIALDAMGKAGGAAFTGFGRMVDALADCKDEAEANGTSFTGEAFSRLKDAVSTGAEYLSEATGGASAQEPETEPEPDAPMAEPAEDGPACEL